MPPLDWNHLRFVLAVVREGGYAAAGRRLNVDPTAVARRIRAIESVLRFKLFERGRAGGLRPTKAAEEVILRAETVEARIGSLGRVMKDLDAS